MKRLLVALACAAALFGAQAQEPAKGKAKKAERGSGHQAGVPKQKIWISPSDRERLEKERAAKARAKKKGSAK
jgi:hypothetical protein